MHNYRKFLAVIDETPECQRAVKYAALRAKNTNGGLVLLFVIDSSEFQNFLNVANIMRAEAEERALALLNAVAGEIYAHHGITAELLIKEGPRLEQLTMVISQDQAIANLILAASSAVDGPGPLVQSIAGRGSSFRVPVTIIPASLSDDDIIVFAR